MELSSSNVGSCNSVRLQRLAAISHRRSPFEGFDTVVYFQTHRLGYSGERAGTFELVGDIGFEAGDTHGHASSPQVGQAATALEEESAAEDSPDTKPNPGGSKG